MGVKWERSRLLPERGVEVGLRRQAIHELEWNIPGSSYLCVACIWFVARELYAGIGGECWQHHRQLNRATDGDLTAYCALCWLVLTAQYSCTQHDWLVAYVSTCETETRKVVLLPRDKTRPGAATMLRLQYAFVVARHTTDSPEKLPCLREKPTGGSAIPNA